MLNPARANSWIGRVLQRALGDAEFELHGIVTPFRALKEAGALAGVADVAVAEPLGLHEHRVVVAVDQDVAHREPVARRLALGPERVARAAEERDVAGAARDVPGLLRS